MNKEEEIQFKISCLTRKTNTLSKLSNFLEEFDYDDEYEPEQIICRTRPNLIFLANPIIERRKILWKYCLFKILINGTAYFLFNSKILNSLSVLKALDFIETSVLTINYDDKIFYRFNPAQSNWKKPVKVIIGELADLVESQNYTEYKPLKFPTAKIPIPVDSEGKKTAKIFLEKYGNQTIQEFYVTALAYHLLNRSGLLKQSFKSGEQNGIIVNDSDYIREIKIKNFNLKKLLPVSITFKKLLELTKKGSMELISNIQKEKGYFIFEFDISKMKELKLKKQTIHIPYELLLQAFCPKCFNDNLKYFLLVIFGYHLKPDAKITYKISTIIEKANLNKTRGYQYLINQLNKPFLYLEEIGIIQSFAPITLDELKKDKAITVYLNPLKTWKAIKPNTKAD